MIQILELFGGIGAPRCAFRNIGVDVKSIDYVEIDEKAVRSYNAMFNNDYKTQSVVGWNLKPDFLIHGSPCQDFSIVGRQGGADEGSETRSSLMWETIKIIKNFGIWKPKVVIWENVKNIRSKYMVHNHTRYMNELYKLGYVSSYELLDARDFGIPQARQRYFTVSVLGDKEFNFNGLSVKPMRDIKDYLLKFKADDCPNKYLVKSPCMIKRIDESNFDNAPLRKLSIIKNYAMTITTKQNRCPNSGIVKVDNGKYRILTELECWRLQGFTDDDFYNALKANPNKSEKVTNGTLYKQAGNSIAVPVLESLFKEIINQKFLEV